MYKQCFIIAVQIIILTRQNTFHVFTLPHLLPLAVSPSLVVFPFASLSPNSPPFYAAPPFLGVAKTNACFNCNLLALESLKPNAVENLVP